jgi:excisionase family DNA binding protein
MTKTPLTIQEAAESLVVSDRTIRRMLDAGQLIEASRDSRNRIYITPESLDAAAVALGRKKASREELREIAPTLNSQAAALEQAIGTFGDMLRERDQRIYDLQQQVAQLEAERRYLPLQTARVEQLEQSLAEAQAEIERLNAAPDMTPGQVTEQRKPSLFERVARRMLGH